MRNRSENFKADLKAWSSTHVPVFAISLMILALAATKGRSCSATSPVILYAHALTTEAALAYCKACNKYISQLMHLFLTVERELLHCKIVSFCPVLGEVLQGHFRKFQKARCKTESSWGITQILSVPFVKK